MIVNGTPGTGRRPAIYDLAQRLAGPTLWSRPGLTGRVPQCYREAVLVEERKQSVAEQRFRGASEARAKGATEISAEVADGSPAEAAGGLG